MNKINYVIGDATAPQGEGEKIICHINNNLGGWGAGFVLAISRKWSDPEFHYRNKQDWTLGTMAIVPVESDMSIANMVAQDGYLTPTSTKAPIDYDALRVCLKQVNVHAVKTNASLHMPRIGAGLSGGDWNIIEAIIEEVVTVPVTVYDLPNQPFVNRPF